MKIRGAVMYEYNTPLVVEELDLDPPGPGEVLVKMAASGVCHSDYREFKGEWAGRGDVQLPEVLGHEGAAVVQEVGPGVTSVKPGDHAVLSFHPNCGKCYYCIKGRSNLCENLVAADSTRLRKGSQTISTFAGLATFAEYNVVSEAAVITIPDDVPLDKAALVGCGVTTGVGAALNTAQVGAGESVAVFGTGGVGLSIIQGAALSGADPIIAVDIRENKLAFAREFGATHTINALEEDPVGAIKGLTQSRGVQYAFEAIGDTKVAVQALASVCKGGKAVIVGQSPYDDMITFPGRMLWEEAQLIGSYYGSSRMHLFMPRLIELYQAGKLKLDELVTRTFTLDQINEAFEALEAGEVARGVIRYD
ncbi:MAG: Zn-dependent alcohol dehydrogenase [Dehalococcoidia bacterium]